MTFRPSFFEGEALDSFLVPVGMEDAKFEDHPICSKDNALGHPHIINCSQAMDDLNEKTFRLCDGIATVLENYNHEVTVSFFNPLVKEFLFYYETPRNETDTNFVIYRRGNLVVVGWSHDEYSYMTFMTTNKDFTL